MAELVLPEGLSQVMRMRTVSFRLSGHALSLLNYDDTDCLSQIMRTRTVS